MMQMANIVRAAKQYEIFGYSSIFNAQSGMSPALSVSKIAAESNCVALTGPGGKKVQ
jgi:hypothetical protein